MDLRTMSSAETFKENLQKFASVAQIKDFESLASALEFQRDDKRWLKRIWEQGLSRPDPRRAKQLRKVASFLKVENIREFWNPQFEVGPFSLLERRMEWTALVSQVIDFYNMLQQAKLRRSQKVHDMLAKYGFDEPLFIGDMVAAFRGQKREEFEDVDLSWYYNLWSDLHAASGFAAWVMAEEKMRLRNYVVEKLSDHPAWNSFLDGIWDVSQRTYGASSEEEHRENWIEMVLDRMLSDLQLRPASPQDILRQFKEFYLDESPHLDFVTEGLPMILQELRCHERWDDWVEAEHNGDTGLAESVLGKMWNTAVEQTGHELIKPEHFISYIISRMNAVR